MGLNLGPVDASQRISKKNIFHCFKCGCGGNALELWAKVHQLTLYDAAIDLCQRLNIAVPLLEERNRKEEPVDDPEKNSKIVVT